jgi:hypothetical protein
MEKEANQNMIIITEAQKENRTCLWVAFFTSGYVFRMFRFKQKDQGGTGIPTQV